VRDVRTPLIHVYMTVRNGRDWVVPAIRSVMRQSFGDWQLIVVDDGSSDGTGERVIELAREDARITYISTSGIGRGQALNLALSKCTAALVANLDADDMAHPERLRIQIEMARLHPEYSLFCTDTVTFVNGSAPGWAEHRVPPLEVQEVTAQLAYGNPVNHSSVLARHEALLAVNGYDERRPSQFDYDLWVRMAGAGFRLARIKVPLTGKRVHGGQHFGSGGHFFYILRSLRIQLGAIMLLRAGVKAWLYLAARFFWAMLPRRVRMRARALIHG
jgi:teichuronic acid biosynthesis glycosyltransferase TuaG